MFRALLAAALLAGAAPAPAAVIPLPGETRGEPVGRYADVLEDTGGTLRRENVMAPQLARGF
jgi:hypothetical protein